MNQFLIFLKSSSPRQFVNSIFLKKHMNRVTPPKYTHFLCACLPLIHLSKRFPPRHFVCLLSHLFTKTGKLEAKADAP